MRAEIRAKRHLDKMKAAGVEFTPEEEELILARFMKERVEQINEQAIKSREAESVLALIARQELFVHKECRKCHGLFASDYAKVAYCSDSCRKAALEDIGIEWDSYKSPEERWGWAGEPYHDDEGKLHNKPYPAPLVVPPEALKVLANIPAVRQFFKESMLEIKPEEGESQSEPEPVPEPEPQVDPAQALVAALSG